MKRNVPGSISLDSSPSGCRVYLNGAFIGGTPIIQRRLNSGYHLLTVVLEGEYNKEIAIKVEDADRLDLGVLHLNKRSGSLLIDVVGSSKSSSIYIKLEIFDEALEVWRLVSEFDEHSVLIPDLLQGSYRAQVYRGDHLVKESNFEVFDYEASEVIIELGD